MCTGCEHTMLSHSHCKPPRVLWLTATVSQWQPRNRNAWHSQGCGGRIHGRSEQPQPLRAAPDPQCVRWLIRGCAGKPISSNYTGGGPAAQGGIVVSFSDPDVEAIASNIAHDELNQCALDPEALVWRHVG